MKFVSFDIVFQEIPDEVTLAINISGCPNRCAGCHSAHLMEDLGEELDRESLDKLLEQYRSSITCVCFMGGDQDREGIEELGRHVHQRWSTKTAWYSGRELLPEDHGSLDYVKLGGYKEELGGLKSRTTNQRIYKMDGLSGEYVDITSRFWR